MMADYPTLEQLAELADRHLRMQLGVSVEGEDDATS